MSLFDVLAQFIQIFVDLIPRFAVRAKSIEWLVVDGFLTGTHIASSRPVLYWPILDHAEYFPKTEHTIDAAIQTMVTADGMTITVNPEFAFRIIDPLVVRENWGSGYVARVAMILRGAVEEFHAGHNWDHIVAMGHDAVVEEVISELREKGIEVTDFCVEERSPTISIRHFGVDAFSG